MLRNEFERWLLDVRGNKEGSARSRVSNCSRIEREKGIDLDTVYCRNDEWRKLLASFDYTTREWEQGWKPAHGISIYGNWYTGTMTLRTALRLYDEFKESAE